ncbi:Lcn5 [Phodopus roborovskii]|uniref:Lcn5 protein n=1 Tax=Phodopus roborovskii TaxID=109678 RepID=A0AAU9Z9R2_PHORO|nr:Lcn5 [Phodopus roborovskii]
MASCGWGAELPARHMESNILFTLLGLCMCLFVGLAADPEDAAQDDFDVNQFLGFWYEIAFAANTDEIGYRDDEKLGAMRVELEKDLLAMTVTYFHHNVCVLKKIKAAKSDYPWRFRITATGENAVPGDREMVIVHTDYKTYSIIYLSSGVNETSSPVMRLYTRSLDDSEKQQTNFHLVAKEHGFIERDIHFIWLEYREIKAQGTSALLKPGS